jgi:hypothetical protein
MRYPDDRFGVTKPAPVDKSEVLGWPEVELLRKWINYLLPSLWKPHRRARARRDTYRRT